VGWVGASVTLGFAGLAVLAVCAFRVYLGVRRLGRELEQARRRLAPEHSALRDELRLLQEAGEARTRGDGVRSS
jgi:HAMP domain-containing protein